MYKIELNPSELEYITKVMVSIDIQSKFAKLVSGIQDKLTKANKKTFVPSLVPSGNDKNA